MTATKGDLAVNPTDAATTLRAIPKETVGPYPADGSNGPNVLAEEGVIRRDIKSSFGHASHLTEGVATTLELTILDISRGGAPFEGAAVYIWQCDNRGLYSVYSPGLENENFLRGVQIADAEGKLRFTTIYPGCYEGRWPHFHVKVYTDASSIQDPANTIITSQIALPEAVSQVVYAQPGYELSVPNASAVHLHTDTAFGDDLGALQLATVTGDLSQGYVARLVVAVDGSSRSNDPRPKLQLVVESEA
jgi:protocatechuate 3,4-dioxygenase beta subunit